MLAESLSENEEWINSKYSAYRHLFKQEKEPFLKVYDPNSVAPRKNGELIEMLEKDKYTKQLTLLISSPHRVL